MDDLLPPWQLDSVPADAMIRWAALLRDTNPIHADPAAAAALGFGPRTVNPGPANLAYAINMLMAALPGRQLEELTARFGANVLAGDAILVSGEADGERPGQYRATVGVPARDAVAVDVEARFAAGRDRA